MTTEREKSILGIDALHFLMHAYRSLLKKLVLVLGKVDLTDKFFSFGTKIAETLLPDTGKIKVGKYEMLETFD